MALKKHHKWMIGSFSSLVIIFMIVSSILFYSIYVKQEYNYNSLNDKIAELQADTQTKINILTGNIMQTTESLSLTQENLQQTQLDLESNQQELDLLKASAGEDFSGIIEEAIKGVVTIQTNSAQGTGFIISSEGYVITNAHVLADDQGHLATGIRIITSDQTPVGAEFIGYDGELDVALLKVEGDYHQLELGNSDDTQIGEKVIAIGNPLGLQFSVTEGIISAKERPGANGISAYFQTDAALNPGNSGGPLINKQGKIIGINNFKISTGENLGFALESNYLKNIINQISQEQLNQTLIN
ncbi:trypsin-like peptidase domain-containing protein [Candidatus Pacearchaeota archaeon]|nr:trypsin-like peptidase domain-containing protein [Candidatus Pacearchaeota archaeon]